MKWEIMWQRSVSSHPCLVYTYDDAVALTCPTTCCKHILFEANHFGKADTALQGNGDAYYRIIMRTLLV